MDHKLTVVAHIKAKKGHEKQVREALVSMIQPTRAEKGCINYDLHEALEDPGSFVFYENWKSKADLDQHLLSAHIRKAMSVAGALLAEPVKITLWRSIP
jgi:quinol monooxygenase YgiN